MGSEMCIRDSPMDDAIEPQNCLAALAIVIVHRQREADGPAGPNAVSYTHLTLPTIYSV